MVKHLSVVFTVFLFIGIGNLNAQEELKKDSVTVFFEQVDSLYEAKAFEEGLALLEEARIQYQKDENWDLFFKSGRFVDEFYQRTHEKKHIAFLKNEIELHDTHRPENLQFALKLYISLADVHLIERKFNQGLNELKHAITKHLKPDSTNILDFGEIFEVTGTFYTAVGELDTAYLYLHKALSIIQSYLASKEKLTQLSSVYNSLGIACKESDKYIESIEYYEKCIEITLEIGDSIRVGVAYYNLGNTYLLVGNNRKALENLHKAHSIFVQEYGEKHPYVIVVLNKLGTLYRTLHNPDHIEFLQKAHDLSIEIHGKNHPRVAVQKMSLGSSFEENGNCDKSHKYLTEALKILQNQSEPDNLTISDVYMELCYMSTNCKKDSIFFNKYFEKGIALGEKIFGKRSYPNADLYLAKAYYELNNHRQEQSLKSAEEGLIRISRTFNASGTEKFPKIEDLISREVTMQLVTQKAIALGEIWKKNRKQNLIEDFNESISYNYNIENQIIKKSLKTVGTDVIFKEFYNFYEVALDFSYLFHKENPNPQTGATFFDWMEKRRGRNLLASFQKSKANGVSQIPDSLLQKEKIIAKQISGLEIKISEAEYAKDTTLFYTLRDEALYDARIVQDNFISNLEKNYPKYFNLKYQFDFASIDEVKKVLGEDELLISYAIVDDNLYIVTVGQAQSFQVIRVDIDSTITETVQEFNRLIRKSTMARTSSRKRFVDFSQSLYQQFIKPIETQLSDKNRLIVIGDGMTNYIPFEVLLKSNELKPFNQLDFLIKNHEVSYHYSLFQNQKRR